MTSFGRSVEESPEAGPLEARPPVAPGADLAHAPIGRAWLLSCFGAAFLLYLSFLPRFLRYCSPPSGDQPFYLMDTVSLVQDHDLNLKNNYENHDEEKFFSLAPHPRGFVGMSVPRPLGRQLSNSKARPASEQYSVHPPGLPVLLAPAWALGAMFRLWWPATIMAMSAIGALAALNALLLAHEMTGRRDIALAVWAAIAFSNPLMTYSYLIFSELATGWLLIYAFRRLALGWRANGPLRLLLTGACIGYIPWLAWRCIPIAVMLGVYAAWQWKRAGRGTRVNKRALDRSPNIAMPAVPSPSWLAAPVAVSIALILAFDVFRFGTPWPEIRQPGATVAFDWPWAGRESLFHFVTNGFGLLFDIQWGLLTYAPVYLLSAVGLVALLRARPADRRLVGWMAACSLPYLFLVMAFSSWNGIWCPPARYQTTLVPLLAAPLGASLSACRNRLYWILFGLLAAWGFGAMAVMLGDPIRMWPFSDTSRVPWTGLFSGGVFDWLAHASKFPVHLDLRHAIPSFMTPDEATQPVSTGAFLAVSFGVVFLCSRFLLRRTAVSASGRASPEAAWAGAAAVLCSAWYIASAPYLKSRTELVERNRWKVPKPLVEAHGMAYLNGKLYIASLGPRSSVGVLQAGAGELGVFDPATGLYERLQPVSTKGNLPYSYPGDVRTGPDGLLYLLNNGPGEQALYVMRPDGYVVRQLALDGKSPLALGFSIAPDGELYATDMGHVHRFAPEGGRELKAWGGARGNFNNIAGVTVGSDGIVYVAETSEKRIHEFDRAGRFLRTVGLSFQPWQMVEFGEWLDIATEGGILSLDRRNQSIHFGRMTPREPPLLAATALTYGPGDTLYVLSNNAVIAYAVRH